MQMGKQIGFVYVLHICICVTQSQEFQNACMSSYITCFKGFSQMNVPEDNVFYSNVLFNECTTG